MATASRLSLLCLFMLLIVWSGSIGTADLIGSDGSATVGGCWRDRAFGDDPVQCPTGCADDKYEIPPTGTQGMYTWVANITEKCGNTSGCVGYYTYQVNFDPTCSPD